MAIMAKKKRKRSGKAKQAVPVTRKMNVRVSHVHEELFELLQSHHGTTTKVAAIRLALENELKRGPLVEALPATGAFTHRFCLDCEPGDQDCIGKIKLLRHLRTESDAIRLAVEREAAVIRSGIERAAGKKHK